MLLLHNVCVANHTRYYRNPCNIISSGNIEGFKIDDLLEKYNEFCLKNNYSEIGNIKSNEHNKKNEFIIEYVKFTKKLNLEKINMFKSNIVCETISEVCKYLRAL